MRMRMLVLVLVLVLVVVAVVVVLVVLVACFFRVRLLYPSEMTIVGEVQVLQHVDPEQHLAHLLLAADNVILEPQKQSET